jgi:hypothetical protein
VIAKMSPRFASFRIALPESRAETPLTEGRPLLTLPPSPLTRLATPLEVSSSPWTMTLKSL